MVELTRYLLMNIFTQCFLTCMSLFFEQLKGYSFHLSGYFLNMILCKVSVKLNIDGVMHCFRVHRTSSEIVKATTFLKLLYFGRQENRTRSKTYFVVPAGGAIGPCFQSSSTERSNVLVFLSHPVNLKKEIHPTSETYWLK
jgi:hypothetical protein